MTPVKCECKGGDTDDIIAKTRHVLYAEINDEQRRARQQPQTLSIQVLTNAIPSLIQSRPHLFGLV